MSDERDGRGGGGDDGDEGGGNGNSSNGDGDGSNSNGDGSNSNGDGSNSSGGGSDGIGSHGSNGSGNGDRNSSGGGTGPIDLTALLGELADLFRPGPRDAWRGHVDALVRRWLARPDARLLWTEAHEDQHRAGPRLALPGRERPPRHLALNRPLDPDARVIWTVVRAHLATVAIQMEIGFDSVSVTVPPRWLQLLTERQLDVARFASEGLSNEQIAAQLGVAPRTVARLLQDIFKRLGCSNRSELAAERALGRPPTPVHQRVPDDEPPPDAPPTDAPPTDAPPTDDGAE